MSYKALVFNLIILFSAAYNYSFGQHKDIFDKKYKKEVKEKIEYINELLNRDATLERKKTIFKFIFYDDGKPVREDMFHLETLDTNGVYYSEEEDLIIIKCQENLDGRLKRFNDGCIEKTIYKNGVIRPSYRMTFKVPEKNRKAFMYEMKEFIKQAIYSHHEL